MPYAMQEIIVSLENNLLRNVKLFYTKKKIKPNSPPQKKTTKKTLPDQ